MESPEGGAIRLGGSRRLRTCNEEPDPICGWKALLGLEALTALSDGNEGYAQNSKEKKNLFPIFTK
ncbi:hypothetical protein SAMN05421765_2149 [Kaistella antarctica]|uniref:Uncharacterized protein n=1 Tax=Kaistella antarctica TaxID=266748 RepID=A0A3S4W2P9_9FLAO|nr:hypothetical protein HY04_13530 [Kaistella antarctica]SEW06720.1 hypothetical protein SAMN05421765_2149 [Kaistella antarctica]VEH97526.1 Uncharacterised protein [Kaistella antarctica]